jgi:hypothetical protein
MKTPVSHDHTRPVPVTYRVEDMTRFVSPGAHLPYWVMRSSPGTAPKTIATLATPGEAAAYRDRAEEMGL